jgi:hypothetical protein
LPFSPTIRSGGGSRFKVDPDPPEAGQPLEVTYVGPAEKVEYQVDGSTPVEVTPNGDGKFTIDPVPSGQDLWLTDRSGIPGFLHRGIAELDKGN